MQQLVAKLGSFQHIERERGAKQLQELIDAGLDESAQAELTVVLKQLEESEQWEHHLGALLGAQVAIPALAKSAYDDRILAFAQSHLRDGEVRVRNAVADTLGALTAKHGTRIWHECKDDVMASIRDNYERQSGEATGESGDDRNAPGSPSLGAGAAGPPTRTLMGALLASSYTAATPGQGTCRHMTEGWKALESSVRCVHRVATGAGAAFAPEATPELRGLLYQCFNHMNRFVRETAYLAQAALCASLAGTRELTAMAGEVADRVNDGLSDNWSQVRFAASRAARELCVGVAEGERDAVLAILLPAMCLNRYYVAEGVRVFSQETWRLLMGDAGRERVAQHIEAVVPYYISQSKANNHAVREAACACMAELCAKVERAAVAPHVPAMLQALLVCFKDESWPCRDAASTACGRAVANYAGAAAPVLPDLYRLWLEHLWDNVPSVRENAAVALGRAAAALGDDALQRLKPWLEENLLAAREQTPDSQQFGQLENTTQFGVAGGKRTGAAAADAKHTDQAMFSCGSLAPKLRAGCMDHSFARDKEPWEASDGAVYLLRELASTCPDYVASQLPAAAELATLDHFEHAHKLRATLWSCLPALARRVGKAAFRPHVELFLDAMFRDLRCGQALTEVAAGNCTAALRDWFGVSVFAGRLSEGQKALLVTNKNIPVTVVWTDEGDERPEAQAGSKPAAPKRKGVAARMRELPPGSGIPNLLECK